MKGMMILAALVAATACRTVVRDRCPVGDTRCDDEVAQICDPQGRWQTLLDCRRVAELNRATFACAAVVIEDGEVGRLPGHTCIPGVAPAGAAVDGGAP